jgi:hypothetical protein
MISEEGRLAIVLPFFLWFLHAGILDSGTSDGRIVINQGRYDSYYHLRLALKADSIDFAQSDRFSRSGGQFELKLRRQNFPVPAPNCRGAIILRMPWTPPDAVEAEKKIAVKENLLKHILALQEHSQAILPIVIELNPYVEIVSRKPLKLQLTQCNVFFRDAHGEYVDHTGPLRVP